MKVSTKLKSLVLATTLIMPFAAHAESNLSTGCTPCTATARVDFTIVIPKILFLRVGTAGATIDLITFNVAAANVGNAVAQAATAGSGDLGNGAVTAIVQGNNGTVTLTATNGGAITNGGTGTINYSEIITTPAALGGFATLLNAPVLGNGATSSTVTINPAPSKVVNSGARWTYTYANSNVVEPGTYGGVGVNNGRVTYTASMP